MIDIGWLGHRASSVRKRPLSNYFIYSAESPEKEKDEA